jgi:hypothetical protein
MGPYIFKISLNGYTAFLAVFPHNRHLGRLAGFGFSFLVSLVPGPGKIARKTL